MAAAVAVGVLAAGVLAAALRARLPEPRGRPGAFLPVPEPGGRPGPRRPVTAATAAEPASDAADPITLPRAAAAASSRWYSLTTGFSSFSRPVISLRLSSRKSDTVLSSCCSGYLPEEDNV